MLCRHGAILATRFPLKAPELWAYQSTIVKAVHSYEGANWVAYYHQFRRDTLARKDLNWSTPNSCLYNEAFTGRAKSIPRCPHCRCEDHVGSQCPLNLNPLVLGWLPGPQHFPIRQNLLPARAGNPAAEICRNYNNGRCHFTRCRYQHNCNECGGPHPAISCPRGTIRPAGEGAMRGKGRQTPFHPYVPARR